MPLLFQLRITSFLATVAFVTVACERQNVSTRLVLLTAPKWHLSDYVFWLEAPALPGAYVPVPEPCYVDDITIFKADGTCAEDEGPRKWRPDVPQARRFR